MKLNHSLRGNVGEKLRTNGEDSTSRNFIRLDASNN